MWTRRCVSETTRAQLWSKVINKHYTHAQPKLLRQLPLSKLFSSKAAVQMLPSHASGESSNPVSSVTLNSPQFQSLFTEGFKILQELFETNNYELRLCGGVVRDLLMNKQPHDLDLATVATPEQMLEMFEKKGIRIISTNGIGHGTVTCRIAEENFEVTTLRIDKTTDGRHAEVVFTHDWYLDASRRDLTFNSMFLTLEGKLIDYFDGKSDLEKRRVRFVGEADERIKEDFLRIMRYFRFFARVATETTVHDKATLLTISENSTGMLKISGERIWTELKLILNGRLVAETLKMMQECGLFPLLCLPNNYDVQQLERVCSFMKKTNMQYISPIAAIVNTTDEIEMFSNRMKLSNSEYYVLLFIVLHKCNLPTGGDRFKAYIDLMITEPNQSPQITYVRELMKFAGDIEALDYFTHIIPPKFPLSGGVVASHGNLKGKQVSIAVWILFQKWKTSGYTLTKNELLASFDNSTDWNELRKLYPKKTITFPPKRRRK